MFARLAPVLSDPAIAKVGHDLKFVADRVRARRRRAGGRRSRHDGAQLSARRDAIESLTSKASRSSARTIARSPQEDVTGKGVEGASRSTRVPPASLLAYAARARGPAAVAGAEHSSRTCEPRAWTRVYRELEQPLIPVLADIERAGVQDRRRRARARSARTMQARARRAQPAHLRATPAASSTSTRPSSWPRCCSSKLNLQATQEDRQDARRLDRASTCSKSWRSCTRCRRSCCKWREHSEAQGHVRRRAADARQPGDRPRAHDVQSGGGRDGPAEQQRSQPAEHSDPHAARPRDPRRRSSPSPATS